MPRRARAAGSAVAGFCVLLVPVSFTKDPLQLSWCQGGNLNRRPGRGPLSLRIRHLLRVGSLELAVATEPKSRKDLKKKKGDAAKAFSPPKVALRVLEAKIAVGMVKGRAACPVVLLCGSKRIKYSVPRGGLAGRRACGLADPSQSVRGPLFPCSAGWKRCLAAQPGFSLSACSAAASRSFYPGAESPFGVRLAGC